jgi:hypothetical protein
MPSTLIVGEVIHTHDLSKYNFAKGGYAKDKMFGSRGFYSGGDTGPPNTKYDIIEYINIGTQGNAVDSSAEMTEARSIRGAMSDGMRGLICVGGQTPNAVVDTIEYINIQSIADAQDFGEATQAREFAAAVTDGSRGIIVGGSSDPAPATYDTLDFVSIGTTGNAVDFDELTTSGSLMGTLSDGHYGVIAGKVPIRLPLVVNSSKSTALPVVPILTKSKVSYVAGAGSDDPPTIMPLDPSVTAAANSRA